MPYTALHGARTLEQLAAALQAGADVDAQDEYGSTAMMLAAKFGARRVLECAVEPTPRTVRLSYFYRPPSSSAARNAATPYLFVHGIGVGPAPYAHFLRRLGEASGESSAVPAKSQLLLRCRNCGRSFVGVLLDSI